MVRDWSNWRIPEIHDERRKTMSQEAAYTHTELATRLREVLKEHQRDGLSMIGNVDKLVNSLVQSVQDWIKNERLLQKKTA
jgi:hypothetical protein